MSALSRASIVRVLIALVFGMVALQYAPLAMPVGMDFSQVLLSAKSVLAGGSIYGIGVSQASTEATTFALQGALPYAGPPWTFPVFLPLGLLAPTKAAALWAVTTVLFVCATVALVSPGLSIVSRAILAIVAIVSAPVQGHLIVGQTTIVMVLGFGLVIAGYRNRASLPMALGLALLTFRPHLGVPIVFVTAVYLFLRERPSLTRSGTGALVILGFLTASALLIDSSCVRGYSEYISALNALPSNKVCDTCSSLPVLLTDRSPDAADSVWIVRFVLAGTLMLLLVYPILRWGRSFSLVLAGAACAALLAAPYNRNYDFIVLLVPFILVGREACEVVAFARTRAVLAMGLVVMGAIVSGALPYVLSRSAQGQVLWLSAAYGYAATLVVAVVKLEPQKSKKAV